jgi:Protein of unknown function (DUF2878)
MSAVRVAMNVLSFQAAWLAGVGGAAGGWPVLGAAPAVAAAAAHLATAPVSASEWRVLAVVAALGSSWDAVPAALGWIDYRGGVAVLGGLPWWIVGLWLAFATTLNVSLRWLRGRTALAAVLGAVGGPLSYAAAERLGALTLVEPTRALAAHAIGWAVLLPAASAVAARLDGAGSAERERARD